MKTTLNEATSLSTGTAPPPSDSSVYSINFCRKVEYVPQDRSYFI